MQSDGLAVAEFQSTPPARGATCNAHIYRSSITVSIHAPRAGGDEASMCRKLTLLFVSIHAPRAGGDCSKGNALNPKVQLA